MGVYVVDDRDAKEQWLDAIWVVVPSTPPIPRNGKSPKTVITENNLKNGCSDIPKSVSIRKEGVVIVCEDGAGSFDDVETSAALLNDIKPSKLSLLSKLLTVPGLEKKPHQ